MALSGWLESKKVYLSPDQGEEPAAWTPAEISPEVWLDASDSQYFDNTSSVTWWYDRSGNANHARVYTTSFKPTTAISGTFGVRVLRMSDLQPMELTGVFPATSTIISFIVYDKPSSGGDSYPRVLSTGSAATAETNGLVLIPPALVSGGTGACGPYLSTVDSRSVSVEIEEVHLGSRHSQYTSNSFVGDYLEALFFFELTDSEVELVQGYLAHRWGLQDQLAADHPYKDNAPMMPGISDLQLPVQISGSAGLTSVDLERVFNDIGGNYAKIAMEVGDTGTEVPIELLASDWDSANKTATIYPVFPSMLASDFFALYWDSGHADNANVTVISTAPSAPADADALAMWNLAVADTFFTYIFAILPVRALFMQPYKMIDILRQVFDQPYPMTEPFRALFVQFWSDRLSAMFVQRYGNMPRRRAKFNQVWGAARRLRQMLVQEYGDKDKLIASFDQVFHLNEGLRAKLDQDWAVSESAIRSLFDQVFALEDKSRQRAILHQLWVLAAGEAVIQKAEVTVTAELDGQTRVLTSYTNINDEQDETIFHMTGELQLVDQSEYLFCRHLQTRITVEVEGDIPIHYIVDEPTVSRNETGKVYVVPLKSETVLLNHQESEYSQIDEQEFSGMRKALVEQLSLHFPVNWHLKNTYLPPGILRTNGRTRMAIIEEIVDSLGGIVQTSAAGVLVCRKEYPKPVNTWKTEEPDVELTDQDDAFSIVPQPSSRPGYNKYFISNSEVSGDDLRKEEIAISEREKIVRVYLVPWLDRPAVLGHSGGSWVKVFNDGVKTEVVEEKIEIVLGEGQLPTKTCYGIVSVDWKEQNLGELKATEAGEVTTEIAENSMVLVRWKTKYHQFRVINDRAEDVQVWPLVV